DVCATSFPCFDRKFIKRRDSGNKGTTGRPGYSEIELCADPLVRNIFYSMGKARGALCMWCCFRRSRTQESFGQWLGYECAGSNFRLKIAFEIGRASCRERG